MSGPLVLDATQVRRATPWPELIGEIGTILGSPAIAPERHVHALDQPDGTTSSLLLMPGWLPGDSTGVKVVTYVPSNAGTPVPTVNAAYLLFDGRDGRLVALLDGDELTARRTAAISALAATHLSRPDATRLLVVGTGRLAPNMAQAYHSIRDLELIEIWGRDRDAAAAVARELAGSGIPARPTADLSSAVHEADIVTCVTGATAPLVSGDDLAPGSHLDLVGSFRADMREADDAAVVRATIFVDTVAGAVLAGDLAQPLAAGVVTESAIAADLADLAAGRHPGRTADDEITLFKSAGFALADLAAARLAVGAAGGRAGP